MVLFSVMVRFAFRETEFQLWFVTITSLPYERIVRCDLFSKRSPLCKEKRIGGEGGREWVWKVQQGNSRKGSATQFGKLAAFCCFECKSVNFGSQRYFSKEEWKRSLFLPPFGISLDFEFRINLRIFMLDLVKLLITPIFSLVLSSSSAYLNWTRLTTFSKKKELQKPLHSSGFSLWNVRAFHNENMRKILFYNDFLILTD